MGMSQHVQAVGGEDGSAGSALRGQQESGLVETCRV